MTTKKNYGPIVDELGRIKARKTKLKEREDELNAKLRKMGAGAYEGFLFRATVGEDGKQIKRDAQAMRDKLWSLGFYAFVKKHEKEVGRAGSVRVVARTGEKLKKAS